MKVATQKSSPALQDIYDNEKTIKPCFNLLCSLFCGVSSFGFHARRAALIHCLSFPEIGSRTGDIQLQFSVTIDGRPACRLQVGLFEVPDNSSSYALQQSASGTLQSRIGR